MRECTQCLRSTHTQHYTQLITSLIFTRVTERWRIKIRKNSHSSKPCEFHTFISPYSLWGCYSANSARRGGLGDKNTITSVNTLYQTVLILRNALTEVGLPRDLIKTIARRGMMMTAEIERTETESVDYVEECEIGEEEPTPPVLKATQSKMRASRETLMMGSFYCRYCWSVSAFLLACYIRRLNRCFLPIPLLILPPFHPVPCYWKAIVH